MGGGHHLNSYDARLRLPGRRHRQVQPQFSGLTAVDHRGRRLLHRSLREGDCEVRKAWDLQ